MPIVDPVIERVLADFERRAEDEQRRTMAPGAPAPNRDDLLLSVGRDAGILLYLLATGAQSRRILELGTSYGYSTVWLGAAAHATGGKVMSLENKEFKIEHARQALTRAGLSTRSLCKAVSATGRPLPFCCAWASPSGWAASPWSRASDGAPRASPCRSPPSGR